MTMAMPMFRRQLKAAMVRMTKSSMRNRRMIEQIMPSEMTLTSPKTQVYMNQGRGSLCGVIRVKNDKI